MVTSLNNALDHPAETVALLTELHPGVLVDRSWAPGIGGYVLDLTFAPPPELSLAGFGRERARISIHEEGDPLTYPLGPPRKWKHRWPSPFGEAFEHCCGQLCLWVPEDPRPLRWVWEDGLEDYVDRVHRHLFLEEHWRRTGRWPTEDAPHGAPHANSERDRSARGTHPIRSKSLRRAVTNWQMTVDRERRSTR
jgi:hypothetical protein